MTDFALLSQSTRDRFIDRFKQTMVGRPEVSPHGWIIQEQPVFKRLHLEEWTTECGRHLLALAVVDRNDRLVGCWPVMNNMAWYCPHDLRALILQVCNAPNTSMQVPKTIHLTEPCDGIPSGEQLPEGAGKLANYVRSMLRRNLSTGLVCTKDWTEAWDLIETFRPWCADTPRHWWERSRSNEVNLYLTADKPKLTLTFVPADASIDLDRSERPQSCLLLENLDDLSEDLRELVRDSTQFLISAWLPQITSYTRNATDDATPPLQTTG